MRHDVAVLGLGPAGRALAHRLLVHGARVLAVDPRPDRVWQPTYAGWADHLPAWLPADVVGANSRDTVLHARARHHLTGEYVVLDNAALHRALSMAGAEILTGLREPVEVQSMARVVVDCRGSHPHGAGTGVHRDTPAQTAFGLSLSPMEAAPLLRGAEAVMMDWRPFDGSQTWGRRRPSFCYVIPLPDGQVLAEETCLAGAPALAMDELRHRLQVRLLGAGVRHLDAPTRRSERVHIPLLPLDRPGLVFGAAGTQLNPISGYSVFSSLAAADGFAQQLLAGDEPPTTPGAVDPWRRTALHALLHLSADATVDLFDAFARLPRDRQRAVLDPASPRRGLLTAMASQWWRMPSWSRPRLVGATARGLLAGGGHR